MLKATKNHPKDILSGEYVRLLRHDLIAVISVLQTARKHLGGEGEQKLAAENLFTSSLERLKKKADELKEYCGE